MANVLPLAVIDGEPRIDSRLIASQLGTEHKNTRELIEQYQADFEEFGVCPFETAKPPKGSNGGRPEKFALLNEDQSYLLLTYCQNTEQARDLKKRLVQAFSECRRQLQPTTKPAPKLTREERYRLGVYRDAVKTAELIGLSGNMARLAADAYCKNTLGCSVLEPLGATHLLANEQGRVYTPTELGQMLAVHLSARQFNLALEAVGLQKREMGEWMPTDDAKGLFEWADTAKRHSDGTPVKQLRWFKAVLSRLPSQQEAA
ncbi:MAG: Rha family transcriptional regulator [Candidatus Competibacter denitrificans]|jgi:phage regulator Rha-like protein